VWAALVHADLYVLGQRCVWVALAHADLYVLGQRCGCGGALLTLVSLQENMELKIELWVLLAELEKEGAIGSKRKVWKAIKNLCQSLGKVLVNAPPMRSRRERGVRYHVMGVDIMLLQDDAVSLIEVNSSPALSVGADDEDIKTRMYGEAVKIVMAVCRGEEEAAAAVAEARKKRVWQELAMKRADKDDWRSWGGGSKEAGGRKQQHCIIL